MIVVVAVFSIIISLSLLVSFDLRFNRAIASIQSVTEFLRNPIDSEDQDETFNIFLSKQ